MDYNKLKTFITVADLGSITQAATLLMRSQSAISQQIQSLEQDLEMKLLERKNAKIFLSQDGEDIYQHAKKKLIEIDDQVNLLRQTHKKIEGHIRVGELDDFGNSFRFGECVANFLKEYPSITVSIQKGTSETLEENLLANKIDFSLSVYFNNPELVHQYPVDKSWHSLYTSQKYLEESGPIKNYKKIVDCQLIDLDQRFICLGTYLKKNAPNAYSSLMHRRPNIVVANHFSARQIVCSGYGIAILPDYFVRNEIAKGKLLKLMPKSKSVFAGLDLAVKTNKTLRLCEKIFRDYVITFAKN
jgi:DNA-binding transcriptional LysR family regulator